LSDAETIELHKSLNSRVRTAQPKAYGLAEAASTWAVSPGLLRKLILKGDLRAYKIGARVIIKIEDWESYLAAAVIQPQGGAQ
jgi:excisionase family DNA binding protein